MNQEQLDRAKAIVMADATGTGRPMRRRPNGTVTYCAVGGLAKATGMSDDDLDIGETFEEQLHDSDLVYERIKNALRREFGIAPDAVSRIWLANDSERDDIAVRRRVVCAALDAIHAEVV